MNTLTIENLRTIVPAAFATEPADRVSQRYSFIPLVRGVCEVCKSPNADAHHDDYKKPLEVKWLCRSHHLSHHYESKQGVN